MTLATVKARDPTAAWCIARTLPLEGGLADNPHDPGGITDFGVSLRYALAEVALHPDTLRFFDIDHDGHVDRKDIAGLSADDAADIYYACWWQGQWWAGFQPALLAWKCFDVAVNTGPLRAALLLQKALCDVGEEVGVDAVVGPKTRAAVGRQTLADNGAALVGAIRARQAEFYAGLVKHEPSLGAFLKGWLARAAA